MEALKKVEDKRGVLKKLGCKIWKRHNCFKKFVSYGKGKMFILRCKLGRVHFSITTISRIIIHLRLSPNNMLLYQYVGKSIIFSSVCGDIVVKLMWFLCII